MTGVSEADIAALRASGLFDEQWYLEQYPDVKLLGMDPAEHYLWVGKELGRGTSAHSGGVPRQVQGTKSLPHAIELSFEDTFCPILPATKRNYRMPQKLRDYLVDTSREAAVPQVTCLMDLVVAYGGHEGAIEQSPEYSPLVKWLRDLAQLADKGQTQIPDVSIVIPVSNHLVFTLAALASILGNASRLSYEILISDDCSSDGTAHAIPAIGGCVRHIRNPSRLGFLRNCNRASEMARGWYLVMLNNDTITLPGWLDHLIGPFLQLPNVGLVGSKLLNNDGSLQEAGGIVWNDGSAWNFGRNHDAHLPEFNYMKETDYCSGASIAFPTEVWRRVGGFDQTFAPAYCEDTDVAFRVREMGLKVLYQPHSDLIHHEGISHGREVAQGIKAYQVTNTKKFIERWGGTLRRDHFPNSEQIFVARDRSRDKPHILIVDHYVPQWDKDAGSRSIHGCIRFFIDCGFHVTLWPDNLFHDHAYTFLLQEMGVEVIYGSSYVGRFESWWEKHGPHFRYVFLSRAHISLHYIDAVRRHAACPILYYGHDIPWKRMLLEYKATDDQKIQQEIQVAKDMEDTICRKADYIIYPAAEECDYAREHFLQAKGVIQMPVLMYDADYLEKAEANISRIVDHSSFSLIFVGGFGHRPNGDGVRWFLNDVLPLIRRREPRCTLFIVGSHMPDDIRDCQVPGVDAKGWVSDEELERLSRQAACTIAPLRFGAGVKGKVIGAFASGSPVVSTSIGMQGIGNPDDIAFVGDTATEFAEAVLHCMKDRVLAEQKARNALSFVRQNYSRQAMARAVNIAIPETKQYLA